MLSHKDFQADQTGSTADWHDFDGDPADFDGDQVHPGPDYAVQHANRADRTWVIWLWPIIWKECCLMWALVEARLLCIRVPICTYVYLRVPTCTYVYLRVPKTHMLTEVTEILNHQYSDAILNRLWSWSNWLYCWTTWPWMWTIWP